MHLYHSASSEPPLTQTYSLFLLSFRFVGLLGILLVAAILLLNQATSLANAGIGLGLMDWHSFTVHFGLV